MFIPRATYRVQLNKNFTFSDLNKILEYLHELGVSTIYASPVSAAVKGSTHGYDVTDPHQINPEIGTEEELRQISNRLKEFKMDWLQDIVPNHMAVSPENRLLMDVLERGPVSSYYDYFDIAWNHPASKGKLMLFVLSASKPDLQQLKLELSESGFYLVYNQMQLPFALPSYSVLLGYLRLLGATDAVMKPLVALNTRVLRITDSSLWTKYKQAVLARLLKDQRCHSVLKSIIEKISADKKLLKQLLDLQYYSLRDYRESNEKINYRRFFTINSLICLRMERDSVFNDYHKMFRRLFKEQLIQGLRIDHLDGLADPGGYLRRLRKSFGKDCYITVEKILGDKESLPGNWPGQGTTGYDFITEVQQLFTVKNGIQQLQEWYNATISGSHFLQETVLNRMKILKQYMHGEWDNLYNLFAAAGLFSAKGKWKDALGAWICCLPVYRIYPVMYPIRKEEKEILQQTTDTAIEFFPAVKKELYALMEWFAGEDAGSREKILPLLARLMQFTGPLMAKGVEDTSFYTWNVLIARNEVGDAPDRNRENRISEFHKAMQQRQQSLPYTLNASSTHDTKRGEDARVRLLTITEDPAPWLQLTETWFKQNVYLVKQVNRKPAPTRNEEYFIYQSIVAAYPKEGVITKEWLGRLQECILKAIREAKQNTSWDDPVQTYEQACADFIAGIFNDNNFLRQLKAFMKKLDARAGIYSLSQLLLKLTAPGVPDIYQGSELYDYSFVDPDNRRAVDYTIRKKWLSEILKRKKIDAEWWEQQVKRGSDKMFVCAKTLALRNKYSLLFTEGEYIPLQQNTKSNRLSFARKAGNLWVIISCPLPGWQPREDKNMILELPQDAPAQWTNLFFGKKVQATDLQLSISVAADCLAIILLMSSES